jgi:hypothetical protein
MAIWITCDECETTFREHSSSMRNTGTLWAPGLRTACPSCGCSIDLELPKNNLFDEADVLSIDEEGIAKVNGGTVTQRATESKIYEKFIQAYFKENFIFYGFRDVEGPFGTGPDFKGRHDSYKRKVKIEVERECSDYISHRHHHDNNFNGVRFLIVLNPKPPSEKMRSNLPNHIMYMDIDHFSNWWKTSSNSNHLKSIRELLAQAFKAIILDEFQNTCTEKERSLANCPDCFHCSYFETEVPYEAMADAFIIASKYDFLSTDFKISTINNEDIYTFYKICYNNKVIG